MFPTTCEAGAINVVPVVPSKPEPRLLSISTMPLTGKARPTITIETHHTFLFDGSVRRVFWQFVDFAMHPLVVPRWNSRTQSWLPISQPCAEDLCIGTVDQKITESKVERVADPSLLPCVESNADRLGRCNGVLGALARKGQRGILTGKARWRIQPFQKGKERRGVHSTCLAGQNNDR
ncbi:hypothetical protein BJX68DRAFT_90246 [Aspergillus pseudodeflectus]|uniref:Uncharacterized protein n=1 Tax=Aspergillus pseudodeflectus TaxID=176178 RepID=A0ABR4L8G0_9EURO